ncbi:MAG: ImmA/IrrE family metallo-endopeptidase [Anaerovoracaceae bacterium]|jgi:Zn-dependent peptidase ImmA (M78 family)
MRLEVSNSVIDWALEQARKEAVNLKHLELLEKWKLNEKQPTFAQIENISRAIGIPFGYFFLTNPPAEDNSMMEYRTVDSLAHDSLSRNLLDILHDMKNVQEWMNNNLRQQGINTLGFVGTQRYQDDVGDFAEEVRTLLKIEKGWFQKCKDAYDAFRYLRGRISDLGVLVMMNGVVGNNTHRQLSIEEFRAFALIDDCAPLIFINSNDSYNGKLFSLLHEFAHVLIGDNSLYNLRESSGSLVTKVERICNAVAAEVLVPEDIFVRKWKEEETDDREDIIWRFANFFRCSATVIARRALDQKYISKNLYERIVEKAIDAYIEKRNKDKEKEGGGNFYTTKASKIDQRFFYSLLQSVQEGRTLYTDAFRLTNTNRNTFDKLAEKVGGTM